MFRLFLRMGAVEAVGSFRHTPIDNGQSGIRCIFQGNRKGFFVIGGEIGQHPVSKIVIGVRRLADADAHARERVGAQTGDDIAQAFPFREPSSRLGGRWERVRP